MPLVGSHQQGAFSTPVNGQPTDASVVLSNDNATRTTTNAHDADATIHIQSSVLASRPAAGTAQRVWITTDGLRAYVDSGSVWNELAYLSLTGGGTVSGAVTVSAALTVTGSNITLDNGAGLVVSGTVRVQVLSTGAAITGALSVSNGVTVSAGGVAVTGNSTITGTITVASGVTISAGGIAATGNSTITGTLGGVTALTTGLANTASGTTVSLANGAGATVLGPTTSGVYLLVTKNSASNAHYAHALVTYDATSAATTLSSLAAASITLGLSGTSVTLTNATGSSNTFTYAYLRLA